MKDIHTAKSVGIHRRALPTGVTARLRGPLIARHCPCLLFSTLALCTALCPFDVLKGKVL